jgi:hypothetical protein
MTYLLLVIGCAAVGTESLQIPALMAFRLERATAASIATAARAPVSRVVPHLARLTQFLLGEIF